MLKSFFSKIHANRLLKIIAMATVAVMAIGVFSFVSNGKASAAANPVSINLIYYGTNSNITDQSIIDANPEYLVNNSPVGPWTGNADISKFMAAGIKYFDYIDGGYEGTVPMAIPNDLQSNLNYIDAIAAAGAYGVFVDEVSSQPSTAGLDYLKQLADRAHSLGLKVVFNAGVDSWSDSLMEYCDYINSSEIWSNAPLTASQTKWASRTWFLTQGVNDATTAAELTNAALSQGIDALYACTSYMALPSWLPNYVTLIGSAPEPEVIVTPAPEPEPIVIPTPEPEIIVTPAPEPEPIVIPTPEPEVIVTPAPEPELIVTPTPEYEQTIAPETTTTTTTTPETTITTTVTTTAPAITTTAAATTTVTTTSTSEPGDNTGSFFSRLWQSIQGIWDRIVSWMGI